MRKNFKKLFTLKIIVNCLILKTVLNSSKVKTAGLIFRIYSDTVGETAMMWDKTSWTADNIMGGRKLWSTEF